MTVPPSPSSVTSWTVGACQVDLGRQLLLRDGAVVAIRPKAWALLVALLQRPNAFVSSNTLLDAIWPRQAIDPKQLVNTASELRALLGGRGVLRPLHRRGYLLVATPLAWQPSSPAQAPAPEARPAPADAAAPVAQRWHFVGRSAELQSLRDGLARAQVQGCQWMDISGVAGVGKSTLLAHWLGEVVQDGGWTVLRGHALDLSGGNEPFGPLIQMLADHAQAVGPERVAEDLQAWAPCWLAQLPALTGLQKGAQLQLEVYRSGEGRMRREGVELLCHWSGEKPVVVVLEDLQWADAATLDFLTLLAQRAEHQPLVIATTRRLMPPRAGGEDARSPHPFAPPGAARPIRLQGFGVAEVRAYLRMRLPDLELRDDQVQQMRLLTDGLPLFLKTVADGCGPAGLSAGGHDVEQLMGAMVTQLRQFVVDRAATLGVELRALVDLACCMAESVPVPVMALALEMTEQAVEEGCQSLVRQGLFAPHPSLVPWRDQRVVKAYGMAHALYREALFGELPTRLLMALSSRIAAALHAGHAAGPAVTSRLMLLYTRLGMHQEAAAAMRLSGIRSLGRFSTRHAVQALQHAIARLQQSPDSSTTLALQLETCWDLSRVMMIEHGVTDDAVEAVRDQIEALAPKVGTPRAKFLHGANQCARFVYGGRADLAREPALQLQGLSAGMGHHEQALAQLWMGNVATAHGQLQEAAAAFQTCLSLPLSGLGLAGLDARAIAATQLTWLQAMTGNLADFRARRQLLEAEVSATRSAYLRLLSSFWMADALRQLGCADAAARCYRELLEFCALYDSASFRDQAQLGLLTCVEPTRRDLPALLALCAEGAGRRPTWSDHMRTFATAEGLVAQRQFDRARALLDGCESVHRHWPLYLPERLRLEGDLAQAHGQPEQAQALWAEALAVDLRRGCLPGVLRHLRRRQALGLDPLDGPSREQVLHLLAPLLQADLEDPQWLPLDDLRQTLREAASRIG